MDAYNNGGESSPTNNGSASSRSEQLFALLVDCATEYAVYMVDESGAIRSWNVGAERIYRYSAPDILERNYALLFDRDDVAGNQPDRQLSIARQFGRIDQEGWRVRGDGTRFLAHNTCVALSGERHKADGFAVITRDLSTRKGLEDRFRQVVESAPSAMVMINAAGKMEMVNEQAERMFGYQRSEMLGHPIENLIPASFRAKHPSLRDSFSAEPASRSMGAGRDLYALRKDGSEFPVEIGLNPIATDQGMMVLSAIVDISQRKRLEERFKNVVEWAPNAMVMISQSGSIEMVNAQAEKVFGYQRSEMLGKPIEMLVPRRFSGAHPSLRGAFFSDPHSRPMGAGRDLYGLRKDGSEFPVEIGLNPIETDEGTMVLSAIVDISDRKQKEQKIAESLREKDILLAEIHHRVKNNLQIVNSLLHLQAGRVDDPHISAMLQDSQNRVHSMAMIHQTLYQSNDFSAVNFAVVLERLIPNLVTSYSLNPRQIDFSIDADEVRLPLNQAIPCGLIVNELIANSLKHGFRDGRTGKISVTLSLNAKSQYVNLDINDNGIGLPEDFNSDSAATLGLQLVTLLVDQLDGELTIQNANPTRFLIEFPFRGECSDSTGQ